MHTSQRGPARAPIFPPLGYGMHGNLSPDRGEGFPDLLWNIGLPIPKWERVRAAHSLELVRQGHGAGSADLTQVLEAERLLKNAETGVVRGQADRPADTVRLFVALGIHPPGWAACCEEPHSSQH